MSTATPKLTPMLKQYLEIKEKYKDCLLFYRMGDFYEMFFEDAVLGSKILGITLTSRNKKSDPVQVPMCGIPYHAVQTYLAKVIRAGQRVAICEQVENPAEAKGIVKREVVRVVSPGVVTDSELLDDKDNNFLAALSFSRSRGKNLIGLAFLDISTGQFHLGEWPGDASGQMEITDQLSRFTPSEIIVAPNRGGVSDGIFQEMLAPLPGICVTDRSEMEEMSEEEGREILNGHFNVMNLDGFGCNTFSAGLISAAALLSYLRESEQAELSHVEKLSPIEREAILHIDDSSRRNLELTQTLVDGQRSGSLLSVLDDTCTPMGARLLKQHLLFPLQDPQAIDNRLDAVTTLYTDSEMRKVLREQLDAVYDLERLNSRIILGSANGRDLLALKNSFDRLPHIHHLLSTCSDHRLQQITESFDLLQDLQELLHQSIAEDPPVSIREGNIIRRGYNQELDEVVSLLTDNKQLILSLEASEREKSGISKLKVGYNKVFGYYIEVSKLHGDKVPEHYIRKQTLVNAERFITPELKEFETKIIGAQDRRIDLEYQLFSQIRNHLVENSNRTLKTGRLLAELDVLASHAEIAHRYDYHRPELLDDDSITILEGRHPVIERNLPSGQFVPNNLQINQETDQMLIITGPNMAGKSTILRQTALIVLMAQMGSYVPAEQARISVVDRIFTRVGAMDNLRRGQSTFMVEMSETANILNNATRKSLVILDEIGRGTSTYDGLSIAWSVAEDLTATDKVGCKTLFATHYHELTELAGNSEKIQNYSIGVREWEGRILFLHKLVRGGTSRSYGIQVASLAGVPQRVVKRATKILTKIEEGSFFTSRTDGKGHGNTQSRKNPNQLSLFSQPENPALSLIREIQPDRCTPLEALELLYQICETAKK